MGTPKEGPAVYTFALELSCARHHRCMCTHGTKYRMPRLVSAVSFRPRELGRPVRGQITGPSEARAASSFGRAYSRPKPIEIEFKVAQHQMVEAARFRLERFW